MEQPTSTFATLSDLQTEKYKSLLLEAEDWERTLLQKESLIRDNRYRWPKSAVQNWGRIWEYPYVMDTIRLINEKENIKKVADLGPGITFFPLWLAQTESIEKVYTIDNDPVCVEGNRKIRESFEGLNSEKIFPLQSSGNDAGEIQDEELDLMYSISVIEHIPNPEKLIANMALKIKKGGYLVITLDVALRDDFGLTVEQFNKFNAELFKYFEMVGMPRITHPQDLLTSINSPIQSERRSLIGVTKGLAKDIAESKIRKNFSDYKLNICCYGFVLRRA